MQLATELPIQAVVSFMVSCSTHKRTATMLQDDAQLAQTTMAHMTGARQEENIMDPAIFADNVNRKAVSDMKGAEILQMLA